MDTTTTTGSHTMRKNITRRAATQMQTSLRSRGYVAETFPHKYDSRHRIIGWVIVIGNLSGTATVALGSTDPDAMRRAVARLEELTAASH